MDFFHQFINDFLRGLPSHLFGCASSKCPRPGELALQVAAQYLFVALCMPEDETHLHLRRAGTKADPASRSPAARVVPDDCSRKNDSVSRLLCRRRSAGRRGGTRLRNIGHIFKELACSQLLDCKLLHHFLKVLRETLLG